MDSEKLIERLYQHDKDYGEGRTQDFFRVCLDCKDAATALEQLQAENDRLKRERDAAVKDLNEFLSMDELCPIQCEWCKWNGTYCDGKTPKWRGQKGD